MGWRAHRGQAGGQRPRAGRQTLGHPARRRSGDAHRARPHRTGQPRVGTQTRHVRAHCPVSRRARARAAGAARSTHHDRQTQCRDRCRRRRKVPAGRSAARTGKWRRCRNQVRPERGAEGGRLGPVPARFRGQPQVRPGASGHGGTAGCGDRFVFGRRPYREDHTGRSDDLARTDRGAQVGCHDHDLQGPGSRPASRTQGRRAHPF